MPVPSVKQVTTWLVVLFVFYAIFISPTKTGDMLGIGWDITLTALKSIASLFNGLVNR